MKHLIILILIFLITGCISKREFETRIAQLEQTFIESQTCLNDNMKPFYVPERMNEGAPIDWSNWNTLNPIPPGATWKMELIGGDSVRVYDEFEIIWVPNTYSYEGVRGNTGQKCPRGLKVTSSADAFICNIGNKVGIPDSLLRDEVYFPPQMQIIKP